MTAESLITGFESASRAGQYRNISRADVARGLRERVSNPDTMYQGTSSLCGPTSLFHCLIRDDPEAYVKYVTDLYNNGQATVGRLVVRPSSDCRAAIPTGMPPVDWVALASLRDSDNTLFDYQSTSNEAAGITMPHSLTDWFRLVGYQRVLNNTNIFITKGEDEIRAMARLLGEGYKVCMFVNATIVENSTQGGGFFTIPNHWVELMRLQGVHDDRVRGCMLWTWRRYYTLPNPTVGQFSGNFFGYVAAKGYSPPRG